MMRVDSSTFVISRGFLEMGLVSVNECTETYYKCPVKSITQLDITSGCTYLLNLANAYRAYALESQHVPPMSKLPVGTHLILFQT